MHVGRRFKKALGLEVPGLASYLDAPEGEFVGRVETGPTNVEVKGRPITLVDGSRAGTFFLVRDIREELQLRERDAVIQSDLESARVFQSMILSVPPDIAPYALELAYRPLDQVGGDLYDVASLPASSVRFFIADATGHGVPAALVTMLVRSVYESVKYTLGGPAAVLEALNDRISTVYRRGDVVFTALVLDLSLETGYVELANGGHPPPILVDSTGAHELEAGGTLLGARGYRTFPSWSRKIEPGASLYLVTDGICEARKGDEYFGQERLEAACAAADRAESATGSVLAQLDAWLAGTRQNDDITLMAIRKRT
jgi:ammonium transporter, Amt family